MPASQACKLRSHTSLLVQKGPALGLMLSCCYLEILNNFVFEDEFCKWGLMGQQNTCVRRGILAICLFAVPCCSICTQPHEFRTSMRTMSSARNTNEYKEIELHQQLIKLHPWLPWGATLSILTKTCFTEERDNIPGKMTIKEPCYIISYSGYFPLIVNNLPWKWWHRRKRKDREPIVPFLSVSP